MRYHTDMNIVVGLGNPGPEYSQTRHNAGYLAADALAEDIGVSYSSSKKTYSEQAKMGSTLIIFKPTTFMNLSGQSVRATLDFFNLLNDDKEYPNMIVLHDDLDLPLGSIKLQYGTGPKSHNGLLSIYEHLGSKMFWHARIGVDNRGDLRGVIEPREYVLQKFSADEEQILKTAIQKIVVEVKTKMSL